ncbi:unnamed protein product [Spirodela intermedia]|uniref:Uncharacterized protein n=1 Tax=Spirodela intermedia TaxID=51605 RepID=A0A7I8JFH1_SPIIN|nr:unnamed protein product [Spirodela intermedia]CAA6668879.1 unnamed protein product [Spirodela intermedia]
MKRVRSHPWTNAITNPRQKLTPTVSPDILPTTSPLFVSLSKKPISCLKMVFKYRFLILAACVSPVTIQQVTSRWEASSFW